MENNKDKAIIWDIGNIIENLFTDREDMASYGETAILKMEFSNDGKVIGLLIERGGELYRGSLIMGNITLVDIPVFER